MTDRPTPTTGSTARTVKHPAHQEGSRDHVLSYHGGIIRSRRIAWVRCSEPACEVNEEARRDLDCVRADR